MMEKQITWEELDQCQSSDEIAELLRKAGIKGRACDPCYCPLAVATGWLVEEEIRSEPGNKEGVHLTAAEQRFVFDFDCGMYSDLEQP